MSTLDTGTTAETHAIALLRRHGYTIVTRNFRCKAGELDIVASERDKLVFVEVRCRTDADHGDALAAIGPRKRAQVARVARIYLAIHPTALSRVRFDIVAITGDDVQLLEDAWRP